MIESNSTDKQGIVFLAWQMVIFAAICWTAIESPLSFVLSVPAKESNLWWDGIISFLFLCDIALNINGFYGLKDSHAPTIPQWQTDKKPYLKSAWFPVDIISSIPFDILAYAFGFTGVGILRLFRLLRTVRLLKVASIYNSSTFMPHGYKIGVIFCGVMIAIHWIACGWMYINPALEAIDPYTFYNKSLYFSITTLTTIGYGDITPTTNGGRIFTMVIMLLGVGTYGVIIGNVSKLIIRADRYKEMKKEKMGDLGIFMKHYNIPVNLQRQVFSFYHHLLNERVTDKDNAILTDLPHALQSELNDYMKIKLIKNVHIFQDCPTLCLRLIAAKLEQSYYSPNDFVIKSGESGEKMFIIAHGEAEVFQDEKIVATLKEGQFFGEIALLEETTRTADVRSKSYCDLYTLHKDDFLEIVEKFPILNQKFRDTYKKRKSDKIDKKVA